MTTEQHYPRAPKRPPPPVEPDPRLKDAEERAGKALLEVALESGKYIDQFSTALLAASAGCATLLIGNLTAIRATLEYYSPIFILIALILSAVFGIVCKYLYLSSQNYLRMQREMTNAVYDLKREFEQFVHDPELPKESLQPSSVRIVASMLEGMPLWMQKRAIKKLQSSGSTGESIYQKAVLRTQLQVYASYLQAALLVGAFVVALLASIDA